VLPTFLPGLGNTRDIVLQFQFWGVRIAGDCSNIQSLRIVLERIAQILKSIKENCSTPQYANLIYSSLFTTDLTYVIKEMNYTQTRHPLPLLQRMIIMYCECIK
jgi:hypothetical protein